MASGEREGCSGYTLNASRSVNGGKTEGVMPPSVQFCISFVKPSRAINMDIMQIELTFVEPG